MWYIKDSLRLRIAWYFQPLFRKPLPHLRQHFQNARLKHSRCLANIVRHTQEYAYLLKQRFVFLQSLLAASADFPPNGSRKPMLPEFLHDSRRVPRVHPERQPLCAVVRIGFCRETAHQLTYVHASLPELLTFSYSLPLIFLITRLYCIYSHPFIVYAA